MKRKLLRCMCWAAALAAGLGFSHSLEARPKERKKATRKVEPFKLPSHVGRVVYRQKRMMLSLYRQLRKNKGNIVLAPHSISVSLSMLMTGAKGSTARGMLRTLKARGFSKKRWHKGIGWLHKHLVSRTHKGVTLRSAQNFWLENSGMPKVSFLKEMQRYYQVAPLLMNFKSQPEVSRKQINDWFRVQTGGRVPSLFPKGSIHKRTRLVLGNAITFLGSWAHPFSKKRTHSGLFSISKKRAIRTPIMYQKQKFKYASRRGVQVLELPYEGNKFSMVLILPRLGRLARLERKLRTSTIRRWMRRMRKRKVKVFLPAFTLSSNWNLMPALAAMGMKRAMSRRADFSKINGKRDLVLASALHQVMLTVNERGAKANAATGLVVKAKNGHSYPEFDATRPFLFFIRDVQTRQILFWGRVVNPNPKAKVIRLPKRRKRS